MRSFLLSVLLGLSLTGAACSKQSKPTAPPPQPEAKAEPAPVEPAPPPQQPQGIAVGEPHPNTPPADPGPRPAAITNADIAIADKVVAVLGKLANGVVTAGADCQAVATHIRAMAPEIKGLVGEGKKMEEKLKADKEAEQWFERAYGPKVMEAMGKMMNSTCMSDPAVSQALQTLNI